MNLVLYKHHNFILCFVLNLKDQTYSTDSRKNLLGNWCQRGRKRSHQSSRGREYSGGERPQMLGVQEERSHMSLRGGKTCSYLIVCISYVSFLCSDFLFPIFSQYPMLDSGGARHLREGNPWIHCTSLPLGTCLYPNRVLSTHSLHVIPVLVLLWFLLVALASRCICVI